MGVFDKLLGRRGPSKGSLSGSQPPRAENVAFLQAIETVSRQDSPENRLALYEAMTKAWFLVPTNQMPAPESPGKHVLQRDTQLSIPIIRDARGKRIVPAFTDEEALAHWSGPSPWFAVQGEAFFQTVAKTEADEIAVNPFRPERPPLRPFGRISRVEFQALAEGMTPRASSQSPTIEMTVEKPQRAFLGMPSVMPRVEIFDALSSTAKLHHAIQGLYFCQLAFEKGAPHGAIAIQFFSGTSQKDIDTSIQALGSAIQPLLETCYFFDFFPSGTDICSSIIGAGKQFYESSAQ